MPALLRLRVLTAAAAILSLLLGVAGCSSASRQPEAKPAPKSPAPPPAPPPVVPVYPVMLGIDVLEAEHFAPLAGKRVGLLTHAAGVNRRGVSTIEVLRHAPGVKLVALFAPEHGLYGLEEAGKNQPDVVDRRTGLPVHSLYGRTKKPTRDMLRGIDAFVIDLQDIGVRSYTFISAMRNALEGCYENNVPVVVLDRPNPLGGLKVDGPSLDPDLVTYVGAFRVPYIHGLTLGELARMATAAPGVLAIPESARQRARLTIVPMRGWRRSMRWPDTGLAFVPTSPFVPDFAAVMGYAMTGLGCEIGGFSHGVGRLYPFRGIAYKGRTVEQLQKELEALHLPGLAYARVAATDAAGKPVTGVYVEVTDYDAWRPADLSFQLMRLACKWSPMNPFVTAPADKAAMFNKLVGSHAWWNALRRDGPKVDVEGFLAEWREHAAVYQQQSRRYWLYPE